MDLEKWNPFPYLDTAWPFDRFVERGTRIRPSMDIVMKDGEFVLTAELPGLSPDDVDISLEGDMLTVSGEKRDEREIEEDDRYVHERMFGSFMRRVSVPAGVTDDDVEAVFDNGVLTVTIDLPEARKVEPKKIPVGTTAN